MIKDRGGMDSRAVSGSLRDHTLYLIFYAPKVNDYHRAFFVPSSGTSGTLFHAVFSSASGTWSYERRDVSDITTSKTLVLMYAISILGHGVDADRIEEILMRIDFDAAGREGNKELNGYSCVLWTSDALSALLSKSAITTDREVEQMLQEARASAGPDDARTMVGKDLGPLRIVNRDS
ncbi:hypothetical protein PVAG01_09022 [Phlyctema vagabunda]|uniref:Uncharacterized protein n=1 Tax=Phlyctema vagabunda TaxID=108571 RepID=A0ABR4P670_9HELO